MGVFWRGRGTDLTGKGGGRRGVAPHIWAIQLNLTPHNLAIGGKILGEENFSYFSEKLFLRNVIKTEIVVLRV